MSNTAQRAGVSPDRIIAVMALGAAVAALALVFGSSVEADPNAGPSPVSSSAPSPELNRLITRVAELELRLQSAQLGGGRTEVLDQSRIDTMVRRALADRASIEQQSVAVESAEESRVDAVAASLAQQLESATIGAARDELWQELRKIGGVDAAVAWFERAAAANPGSADTQTDLGNAYIQQMLQATDESTRIEIGKRIDAQFDQALSLQPDHWEARFRKAVGMTYGPALSGQRSEAIQHFERLVAQQATVAPTAGFSQTYQSGNADRARRMWQQGLSQHPRDEELQRLLR
jgi:tetratricopeptide (TPR) repeat protein